MEADGNDKVSHRMYLLHLDPNNSLKCLICSNPRSKVAIILPPVSGTITVSSEHRSHTCPCQSAFQGLTCVHLWYHQAPICMKLRAA
mmetsp:Transcript_13257/g.28317  ORF Transcript_13257/g.28317 Transcript_13257/m.28317 type:complete len:87 (-) Transcript_13257:562-822(-)